MIVEIALGILLALVLLPFLPAIIFLLIWAVIIGSTIFGFILLYGWLGT